VGRRIVPLSKDRSLFWISRGAMPGL
jgi:hypothetical protein